MQPGRKRFAASRISLVPKGRSAKLCLASESRGLVHSNSVGTASATSTTTLGCGLSQARRFQVTPNSPLWVSLGYVGQAGKPWDPPDHRVSVVVLAGDDARPNRKKPRQAMAQMGVQ